MFGLFKPRGKQAVDKAVVLAKLGKTNEALSLALHGAKSAPEGWAVVSGLLLLVKRYPEAYEAAELALEAPLSQEQRAMAVCNKARSLIHMGQVAKARQLYEQTTAVPEQAMILSACLAYTGASDVPSRDPLIRIDSLGLSCWFPATPRPERTTGAQTFSLMTHEFSFTLSSYEIPSEALQLMAQASAEQNLKNNMERFVDSGFQLFNTEFHPDEDPPRVDFGCYQDRGSVVQLGRFWCDVRRRRLLAAQVRYQDLSRGARIELGRFLGVQT